MSRRVFAGIFVVVVTLGSVGAAGAAQTSGPEIPTSCTVQPVGMLSLLAMLNTLDDARYGSPISSVPLSQVISGPSVSAEDLEFIDFITMELVGCMNSLQVFSAIALLTERFQARLVFELIEGDGADAVVEQLPILATEATESQGIQAIPISSAWYTDASEKSIMAILEPVVADPAAQRSFLVTYVFSIDRWLIDDVRLITGN